MSLRQVLYICFDHIPSPKGAGTHVRYFIEALAGRHKVTLLCMGDPAEKAYFGARRLALPLEQANYLDRALAFREAVWDELEGGEYDVVHYRTMWAALPVTEEARRGFSTVCEVNGVESIELKYHYPALRGRPDLLAKLRAQERLAFTTATALVTPSEVTRHYLVAHGAPEERITVIPNGVDLKRFRPAPAPDNDPPVLLYVGTLAPWQGLEFLLDALRRVTAVRPARLCVLGAGARRWGRELEKRIAKLGLAECVEFLPPVSHEEVPGIIQVADICLCPLAPTERNLAQGCSPVKLFEYLACGKPVVASNLPAIREVLTHEEDGLLFTVSKPARLTDCLLRLLEDNDLRRRLSANARLRAEAFSWRRAQEALLAVYDGLSVDSRS